MIRVLLADDQALVRSCGLYFAPQRLGLQAGEWRDYWQARHAPDWLLDLDQLQPQRRVAVGELLDSLAKLPAQAEARRVLLDVPVSAADGALLGPLGSRLRVKTWSWLAEGDTRARQGGFAGWLVDGTPLWAGGSGTSQGVLKRHAEAIGKVLPAPWPAEPGGCVEVALFDRYPLRSVSRADGGTVNQSGALRGHYRVAFANGNTLEIESQGELFLLAGEQGFLVFAQTLNQQEQHAAGHQGGDQAIVAGDADQHAADYRPGDAAGGPEKAEQGVNHNQLLPIEGFPRPHQRQGIKRARRGAQQQANGHQLNARAEHQRQGQQRQAENHRAAQMHAADTKFVGHPAQPSPCRVETLCRSRRCKRRLA